MQGAEDLLLVAESFDRGTATPPRPLAQTESPAKLALDQPQPQELTELLPALSWHTVSSASKQRCVCVSLSKPAAAQSRADFVLCSHRA